MAEGAGLENRYTGNGIVGSNPTLSAKLKGPSDSASFYRFALGSSVRIVLPAYGGWWWASSRGRRQFPVERDQLGAQRAGEPKIAGIIGGQTCGVGEVQHVGVVDGDSLHP